MSAWELFKEITNPESIIRYGGLALLCFVVFAETGLFIGFFLPGDSLLFTAGLLCGIGVFDTSIELLILSLCIAATAGNIVGYWFGRRVGQPLFKRKDSLVFKQRYLDITKAFYQRHGGKALILGRFLPIVRTFAPILAGVIPIGFKRFMVYNISGSVLWVLSLCLSAYLAGKEYPQLKDYLQYIVIFLIIITIFPIIAAYRRNRKKQNTPPV